MNINIRVLISAITAGAIGAGNYLTAVYSSDGAMNITSIVAGVVFMIAAMGNDIRQQMKLPPVK